MASNDRGRLTCTYLRRLARRPIPPVPNQHKVNAHQELHAEVESLRQEVRSGEKQVQDCARLLTAADDALKGPLKDAKRILEDGRKAEACESPPHFPLDGAFAYSVLL